MLGAYEVNDCQQANRTQTSRKPGTPRLHHMRLTSGTDLVQWGTILLRDASALVN
jgi:hypothetical protein